MQYKRHTISVKISFMHYMKWRRVMFPVVFEEFRMVYMFCYFFLFTVIVIVKRSTVANIWGAAASLPPNPLVNLLVIFSLGKRNLLYPIKGLQHFFNDTQRDKPQRRLTRRTFKDLLLILLLFTQLIKVSEFH